MATDIQLNASVGKNGTNKREDVGIVQEMLNKAGFNPGKVDQLIGPNTIGAIIAFQQTFMKQPDGLIEPGKTTWKRLNAALTPLEPVKKIPVGWEGDSSKWSKEKKLLSLNTEFRKDIEKLLQRLENRKFKPKLFFGWRSVVVQKELFNAKRSKVLFSFHNAQLPDGSPNAYAADIIDKRFAWSDSPETKAYWKAIGEEAKNLNLYWGGDWKNPYDPAHVQFFPNSRLLQVKKESGLK